MYSCIKEQGEWNIYGPKNPDDKWDTGFVCACEKQETAEWLVCVLNNHCC